jgi:hypothetical protein
MWVWRALALPSRLRVVNHLSHDRSEPEARAFPAKFKARTDGRAPFFTSDELPAYVAALIATYSTPEPPPVRRGPGRPRKEPRRLVDPDLRYAQVRKEREGGHVVEVKRQILFGPEEDLIRMMQTDGCGSRINTAYVERDNLTARQTTDGWCARRCHTPSGRTRSSTTSTSRMRFTISCAPTVPCGSGSVGRLLMVAFGHLELPRWRRG